MKQTSKKGLKNQIGAYGEEIARKYLENKGFKVLEQNYLKKWGEIDLVTRETTKKGIKMHFIEVKAVSYETRSDLERAVSHGTWRPEENVHYKKIQRLNRAIESWIMENDYNGEWEIDVCSVRVVPREKYAEVTFIENIV